MAGQVVPGTPARGGAVVLVAGVLVAHVGGRGGDPGHRPVPAADLRLQRRGDAVDLAGDLLRVRRAGHRPVPAVPAGAGSWVPGRVGCGLSAAALARPGAGE